MNTRRTAMVFSTAMIVGLLLFSNTYPSQVESMSPRTVFPIDHQSPASSDERYVDNNISDMDGFGDKGTHSNFAGQQVGPDATYDSLTEENTEPIATDAEDDYDSNVGDADSSPDVGTELNPTNAQGTTLDSQFMTIQETDVGNPYQSVWLDTDVYDATGDTGTTRVGTTPYLDAQDYPTNYVYTKSPGIQSGWWSFPNTTLTGDLSVNISLWCWNDDGANDDGFDVYYDTTGGTGTLLGRVAQHTTQQYDTLNITGTLTPAEVNALRIMLVFYKTGGADEAYVDHLRIGVSSPEIVNYEADFEYDWTNADNDETYEEVCIYVGARVGTENLNVSYWDGGAWVSLGQIGTTGWMNLTALGLTSLTYDIRLQGADSADDTEQGEWTIDLITLHTWSDQTYNYELDLEVQWTTALFDNNNEELCIYAGTTDLEDIQVDVWNGAGWVNLLSDLAADSWNNVSVGTWLTSVTFTIRFRGGFELGDTSQSLWAIDATLLHTWNNIPLNDQQPTVSNIDDTTFIYAQIRGYQITAFVSDQDGYTDIQAMRLSLYSDDRLTLYWTVQYDEDADSFTEYSDPSNYITLNTISSSATKAGNDVDITFNVTVEWNHPDIVNSDVQCYVVDSKSENSTDWYEVDWDIESRLEVTGLGTDDNKGTIDRGNVDGTFFTSGTVEYLGSSLNPPSAEVDVWVSGSEYGTNVGPWEDSVLVSGQFNVTCYADDVVGQDTYTVKVVEEGAGFGGTDLLSSSVQDTYIADRVEFYASGTDDSRIDVDASGVVSWNARYEYDSAEITGGLVAELNGSKALSWNGTHWIYQESKSTVQQVGYSVASATEGTHGLGTWNQSAGNRTIIWDRIRILTTTTQDGRIDYGTAADIRVTAELEYDGHLLGSGDQLYMNDTLMTWVDPYFRLQPQYSDVGLWTFFVNYSGASEATYGITVVFLDGNEVDQIWDRILILTTDATDGRIDYGTSTTVNVTAQLEYDGSLLGSGDILRMNDTAMTWDLDHFYLATGAYSIVGRLTYFVNSTGALESGFGITVVNLNGRSADVIWDRIRILTTSSQDTRIDYGTSADIRVTAELEYDGHLLGTRDSLYMNDTLMTWVDPYFRLQPQFNAVGLWTFFVNSTGAMEATFGITVVNLDGNSVDQIWDRIIVFTTTTQDDRIDYATAADIRVTAQLEFDGHSMGVGDTLYMNDTEMIWVGPYFQLQPQFSTVGQWVFFVNSSNAYETDYGISVVNIDGKTVSQIWDRIEFYLSGVTDGRIDVNALGTVYWNARYDYDDVEITGAILTASLNISKPLAWDAGDLRWEYSESKSSVQLVGYGIESASETTYGLSSWVQTAADVSVIWDRIEFYSSDVVDDRIDIDTSGTTRWRARYAYDLAEITSGLTASLNVSKTLVWNATSGMSEFSESMSSVQRIGYAVESASESGYGLSTFTQLAANTSIIWDKIVVQTTTVDINHLDYGATAQIRATLWLEFDQSYLGSGDSVILNGSAMNWDSGNSWFELDVAFNAVGVWTFFVNSSVENGDGISALDLNSQSVDVIWDRILILSTTVDDSRVNVDDTVELRVTARLEYNAGGDHNLGSGDTLYMDDVTMTWDAANGWFDYTTSKSSVGIWSYFVNATNANEANYGITVVNLDSNYQVVIWDRLVIDIQSDAELLTNGQRANFTLTVTYDADDSECTAYELTIDRNGTYWIGLTYSNRTLFNDTQSDAVYYYNASSVISETTYDITLFVTNTESVNWTAYVPIPPVNEATPNLLNPDDTDNMYARLRYYLITSNVSDVNGYADIRVVTLLLFSDDRATNYWTVKLVRGSGTFSVVNGSAYVTLGDCTYWESGDLLNITWHIKISWDHPDLVDVDVKQVSSNTFSNATDWYEVNWDTETRLDHSSVPSLNDDRGDVDTADLEATGGVTYYNSALYPLANETDVWVVHDVSGAWSGDVDGVGAFTVTDVGSSSSVRTNTYTIKVVAQGAGSGASDLYYTTSPTDTFITDRIEFYVSGVDDARIDYGLTGTTFWSARYDFDDVLIISDLTATLTGSKLLVWNTTYWTYSDTESIVQRIEYGIESANETGYGLSAWTQTVSNTSIIWDHILILTTTVNDNRTDVNSNVELRVTAQLEYDGHALGAGDLLYMDDTLMTWDGVDSRFELLRSQTSVGLWSYFVNLTNAAESTFGITVVNLDGNSQDVIWDEIVVQTTTADDTRVNINDAVEIRVTLWLDYDNTFLGLGDTVTLADLPMSWDSGNSWFELSVSKPSVGMWSYFVNSSTDNDYGITALDTNGMDAQVIWDRIRIVTTVAEDARIDYGTSTTTSVTAELEYDNHALGAGDTLHMNNTAMSWNGSHFELVTGAYNMVGRLTYFVNSSNALESTYGITLVNLNGQTSTVIWDRIRILTTTTQDDRIDYGSSADIRVTAQLEYDNHALGSGDTLNMDDNPMVWVSTYFQYQPTQLAVGSWKYFVNASGALEATYGISAVYLDGNEVDQIWDRIRILTTTTQDGRIDYDTPADIRVTAELEYDNHLLGSGDTLYMDDTQMTWVDPYFQLQPQYAQVGVWSFFVNSTNAVESTYGITYIYLAGNSADQIWDRIEVLTTTADDYRTDIGTTVTISVTAQLAFDGHLLISTDTLYLDDTQLTWNTDHFEYQTSESAVMGLTYYVNSSPALETTYGITNVDPAVISITVIWDRIRILTTTAADGRIDYGTSATISVTAALDYDSHPLGAADTLYMDDLQMTWNTDHFEYNPSQSAVGLWNYYVNSSSANEDTFGITTVFLDGNNQDIIWDRIEFYQSGVEDSRINVNTLGETWWKARYEYDGVEIDNTSGFSGTLNGTKTLTWDGVASRWRYQETIASVQKVGYEVASASETTHGLTAWVATAPDTSIIWDQTVVVSYSADDSRIDIDTASSCHVTLMFDFDDSNVVDGTVSVNGIGATYSGSNGIWDYGETRSVAQQFTYDTVTVSANVHGITSVNQNSQTLAVIWDSLTVTITITDSRINVGEAVSLTVSAIYDFDSSSYGGTLQLNDSTTVLFSAGRLGYTVDAAFGDAHGITAIRQNHEGYCIWDSLTVDIVVADSRIDVGENASITVSAVYDYDNTPYDGILTLNETVTQQISVGHRVYTVDSVSGDSFSITSISTNDIVTVIWDRLRVLSYTVSDSRCDLGSIQEITAIVIREYDVSSFTGAKGTVFLNGTAMSWDAGRFLWTQLRTSAVVTELVFEVDAITDTEYGISAVSTVPGPSIIWDALEISIAVADNRINVGEDATITPSATYLFDGTSYDGTLTLNDTTINYATAQQHWYTIDSALGDDTYGITAIEINDEVFCIWDSLTISIVGPTDQRIDVNTNASGIAVTAVYDYDGTSYDGTFNLNNSVFEYPNAQRQGYTVLSVGGDDTHGITAIRQNAETYCIWDSLTISMTDPFDQRINIGENASGIAVSATYDYDGTNFDGTLQLNDSTFIYPTVGKRGYTISSAFGDSHGIAAISSNDETYCIWDRLWIEITVDGAAIFNGQQANFTLNVTFGYDNADCTTYEIAIARNATYWYSFTDSNKTLFRDTNSDSTYFYNASLVSSESLYGITVFVTTTQKVTWSESPNQVPINEFDPFLSNADDGDNMYARYRYYFVTSNVSDGNGYSQIEYVEITLSDNLRTQTIWVLRYTVSTDTFSIQQGSTNINLAAWSSALGVGTQIDITWVIKIDWDHADLADVDIRQYVTDGKDSDDDYYEVDWDVETRLDVTGLTISDGLGTADRGPLDGSFSVSGTLIYLGSVDDYPLSNETDVWVSSSEYGASVGPWSDFTLVSGQFSRTVFADDAVGQDTITVKAVAEGAGNGGTDEFQSAVQTNYIADRLQVQSYSVLDDRVNVNDDVDIDVTLHYAYDSALVVNGVVTVNSIAATHQGSGVWRITESSSTAQGIDYDLVVYSGGSHGLDQVDQNSQSQNVIWDSLTIVMTDPIDQRINIFENASGIVVVATYDFDSTSYDGTFILNNTVFAYGTAQKQGYTVLSAVGDDSYGITAIRQNDETFCIWDSLTIDMTDPPDQRININSNASGIFVTVTSDYDNLPFDGVFTLNNTVFSYGSAQRQGYGVNIASGGSHGITTVSTDDATFCIWDSLTVSITDPADQRINVDETAIGIVASAVYDYDGSSYDGTLDLNDTSFLSASVGMKGYTVLSALGDDTHGIDAISTNDETWCIWDQVIVLSYSASDDRDNVGDYVWVEVTLEYEYDGTPVVGGTVTDNGLNLADIGGGVWQHNRSESSVTAITFDSVSCSGNPFGIALVNQNSQSQIVIWDSLTITMSIIDRRIDVGQTASVGVSAIYNYDSGIYDGVLTLNDTTFVHGTVGRWGYTVLSALADSFGITSIETNDEDYVIWDQLRILSYWIDEVDGRCNVDATRQVYVTVDYDYDSTVFQGAFGTVYMNGSAMTWNPGLLRWNHSYVYSSPTGYVFQVSGIDDSLHGLTVVNETSTPVSIIWDRLTVDLRADASKVNYGVQVNFTITATRQYDNSRVQALTIQVYRNSTLLPYSGNFTDSWAGTDVLLQYLVTGATDGTYSITEFVTSMIEVIWTDAPVVVIDYATTSDPDGRVDIGTIVSVYFYCSWSTNGSSINTGTLSVNSSLYTINGTGWVEFTHSSPTVLRYLWAVDGANVNGVPDFDMRASPPEMIWDALSVSLSVQGGDYRINVGDAVIVNADITYVYDGTDSDATPILNSSTFQFFDVGQWGYSVAGISGDSYGISVIANVDPVTVVWDALVLDVFVLDNHLDVGATAIVSATATYAFDGTDYDGILTLNDTIFVLMFPGRRAYRVWSADGDSHGIDFFSNIDVKGVIWDQVEVFRSEAENERSDLDSDVEARFWVRYGYDDAPYTRTDGLLSVNGTQATYSVTGGYWSIPVSHSSVGSYLYVVSDFNDGDLSTLLDAEDHGCHVVFDRVYVSSAGASVSGDEKRPPEVLEAELARRVTIYFVLRYEFDGSFVTDPDTHVMVNGHPAEYNVENDRWELTVASNDAGPVDYVIDEFEDSYGLTGIDQRGEIPRVLWEPFDLLGPRSPVPLIMLAAIAISIVAVFARRTLRRVAKLEEALTPEELLILQEAGMPREMREETIANLEWLKELPGEIPNMPSDVLTLLWEELVKARSMYERAFEIRPPVGEAGEQLRKLLLERIESTIAMIDSEIESRP